MDESFLGVFTIQQTSPYLHIPDLNLLDKGEILAKSSPDIGGSSINARSHAGWLHNVFDRRSMVMVARALIGGHE